MIINILECDDWVGLYVDGKCEIQGHSIEYMDILDLIKTHCPELNLEVIIEDVEGLDGEYFPEELSDAY